MCTVHREDITGSIAQKMFAKFKENPSRRQIQISPTSLYRLQTLVKEKSAKDLREIVFKSLLNISSLIDRQRPQATIPVQNRQERWDEKWRLYANINRSKKWVGGIGRQSIPKPRVERKLPPKKTVICVEHLRSIPFPVPLRWYLALKEHYDGQEPLYNPIAPNKWGHLTEKTRSTRTSSFTAQCATSRCKNRQSRPPRTWVGNSSTSVVLSNSIPTDYHLFDSLSTHEFSKLSRQLLLVMSGNFGEMTSTN